MIMFKYGADTGRGGSAAARSSGPQGIRIGSTTEPRQINPSALKLACPVRPMMT